MLESNHLTISKTKKQELQKLSKAVIFKGSKSFSLASLFLTTHQKEGAYYLYAWCRYCDDQTDDQILGFATQTTSNESKLTRLHELTQQTKMAYSGDFSFDQDLTTPVFWGVYQLAKKFRVPEIYFLELLEGMKMDLNGQNYASLKDLDLYCYRVAGVVGLMMCHIMGLKDESALENAAKMGMAMQLTNICRDVKEDFDISRIYLPQSLLAQNGLDSSNLLKAKNRPKLLTVVKALLARADEYYKTGDRGITSLPFRAACAIVAARQLYSEIGNEVVVRGFNAWDMRASVPFYKKLFLIAKSVLQMSQQIPQRFQYALQRNNKCVEISSIWRLT